MQRALPNPLYFETGPNNAPTMEVAPGELFEVQTQLNRGPWMDTHPDGERWREKLRGGNPSSGCITVKGAKAGQLLSVQVGSIQLDPLGFTNYRGNNGAFPGWFNLNGIGPQHRIVQVENNQILWSDRIRLPARPMIGLMGVSSAYATFGNAWCTRYGGNFDVQELTTGATVHLPVAVPGALLHIGDMHAIQGDGEICGAGGIEASGIVQVTTQLSDLPAEMVWPRLTDATHIMVATQARPAEDAFRLGLEELIKWLVADYGFTAGEAYLYLGQVLEARVTQFVNPTFTYLLKVHRQHLPAVTSGRHW